METSRTGTLKNYKRNSKPPSLKILYTFQKMNYLITEIPLKERTDIKMGGWEKSSKPKEPSMYGRRIWL